MASGTASEPSPDPGLTSTNSPRPPGSASTSTGEPRSAGFAERTAHQRRVDSAIAEPSAAPATTSVGQWTPT